MKYKLLLTVIGIGFVLISHSQTVKGKVVDLVDSKPLAGATVTLVSTKDSTDSRFAVSDSIGRFQFGGLPLSTYYLMVSYSGYENYRQVADINDSIPNLDLGTLFYSQNNDHNGRCACDFTYPSYPAKG
ncbi:MAG: carboxypeptidase-like regulatory domain-containing protein [Chitinophagaceae bacterium]|nr:carboxypeptidase-like regulatory domain-containing protein [Chitinophagaceae bacterium]